MSKYQVRFFTGNYGKRQQAANDAGAICYVEGHYNSFSKTTANYALCVLADNAGAKSKQWGKRFTKLVADQFDIPDAGVRQGGRGNGNLSTAKMPAILLEPWFISNPQGARWAKSAEMQRKLAKIVAQTIRDEFPAGGLVALSIGHKGKNPDIDSGAPAHGKPTIYEAALTEPVLKLVEKLLTEDTVLPEPPENVSEGDFFVALEGREERWGDDSGQFIAYSRKHEGLIVQSRVFLGWLLGVLPAQAPILWDTATRTLTIKGTKIPSAVKPTDGQASTALVREIVEAAGFTLVSAVNGVITIKEG